LTPVTLTASYREILRPIEMKSSASRRKEPGIVCFFGSFSGARHQTGDFIAISLGARRRV